MRGRVVVGLVGVLVAALLGVAQGIGTSAAGSPVAAGNRVNTWTSMPQLTEPGNMPPPPFTQDDLVMADTTLRQTVRVTVGGPNLRLRFSNAFGGAALPITAASVALPADGQAGVAAIEQGSARPVTFNGRVATTQPLPAYDTGDHLHLNPAGYRAIADAVPAGLFTRR